MNIRKNFSVVALTVCGLWSASQAMADPCTPTNPTAVNLVANCGFETGDFTGWSIGGNISNPGGNYYGVDTFDAHSGTYGAYMSQDYLDGGTEPVTLSQTVATLAGSSYDISFWLEQDTAPTTGYTQSFSAVWGATTMLSLTPTVLSPGTVGSFTEYSFVETATGPNTTLRFSFENDDSYWSFDDVSVLTPEPPTGLLWGTSFGAALLLLWSRRRLLRSKARV